MIVGTCDMTSDHQTKMRQKIARRQDFQLLGYQGANVPSIVSVLQKQMWLAFSYLLSDLLAHEISRDVVLYL